VPFAELQLDIPFHSLQDVIIKILFYILVFRHYERTQKSQ